MIDEYRSHLRVIGLVVSVFVVGTFGYWLIEDGWTLFDAFYMTAITISTVGYGEVRSLSTAGRLFSVFLIFGGLGSAALFASTMAQAFVERNFRKAFEARRMHRMIQRLNQHYVVCGFGDIGSALCRVLKDAGLPFVVVEDDERTADLAAERGYPLVRGKATLDLTLMRAGVERAEGVVVCLGDDSVNVYVTLAARELNPNAFIIARGYEPDVERRMVRAGADTVVNPLRIGGERVANMIAERHHAGARDDALLLTQASVLGVRLREYQALSAPSPSVATVLAQTGAYEVLKIRHQDGTETHRPGPDTPIAPHETALLLFQEGAPRKHEPSRGPTPPAPAARSEVEAPCVWTDSGATGVEDIDAPLRSAFERIDELRQALVHGGNETRSREAFRAVVEHLTQHFAAQERILEDVADPDTAEHVADHRALLDQLAGFDGAAALPANLGDFLADWLESHIRERDRAMGRRIGARDAVTSAAS